MDVVYVFQHSPFGDEELRYSLRSLQKHLRCLRKVWIFGDRPAFLTDDESLIEHVPHSAVARIGDFPTPVTNLFRQIFLSSLIPELDAEYLFFSDDFILIADLPRESARKTRYLEDLAQIDNRGRGLWKDSLCAHMTCSGVWGIRDTTAKRTPPPICGGDGSSMPTAISRTTRPTIAGLACWV